MMYLETHYSTLQSSSNMYNIDVTKHDTNTDSGRFIGTFTVYV